jgi:two-component system LytT family response regulator
VVGGTPVRAIKVLVVDDEGVSRRRLLRFLRDEHDVEVVGVCVEGDDVLAAIRRVRPDLVFLDPRAGEQGRLDVLHRVHSQLPPLTVFISEGEENAVRAFDLGALDYLLEPFRRERFRLVLERARFALSRSKGDGKLRSEVHSERIVSAGRMPAIRPGSSRRYRDRLMIKSTGRAYFLKVSEIDWIEAADNYVRLHVGKEDHLIRQTLSALETSLDPTRFARIHRCCMVNLDRIRELHQGVGRESVVILESGVELRLSRRYREALEDRARA